MKRIVCYILTLVISFSMMISGILCTPCLAIEENCYEDNSEYKIFDLQKSVSQASEKLKTLLSSKFHTANADKEAVIISKSSIKNLNKFQLNKLLKNGSTIFEMYDNAEIISDYFNDFFIEDVDNTIGYQIFENESGLNIIPISVELVSRENESIPDYVKTLFLDNVSLDEDDYENFLNSRDEYDNISETITDSPMLLQASSDSDSIGAAYADASRTTVYYCVGRLTPTTTALKKGKLPEGTYTKLGYSTVTLSAYSAGGKNDCRYDAFWTTAIVGSYTNYMLYGFTVQNRLYDQNNCSIIDSSTLKDGNKTVTISIGNGLEYSESDGLSKKFSSGFSYSFDPEGLNIRNTIGSDELHPNWVCSISLNGAKDRSRFKVNPMILVRSPKGKTKITKVSARVKNLKFSDGEHAYTVANKTGSEYVYLSVKDHELKSSYE